jgi:prepilin-type N-terminal cleavage/methylation domain-containing protein
MRLAARSRRHLLAGRRRPGEQGLTLIELLLSLAILAVLIGFLAGGLAIGRRAFDADRVNRIVSGSSAAVQTVSTLIGSALPIPEGTRDQRPRIMFDGRQQTLVFVGLSEGRSLRGGPHKIRLRRSGNDLVAEIVVRATETKAGAPLPPAIQVAVLSGVREVHFEYFGKINPASPPGWRSEWAGAEHLPDLVSIRVDFEDERRNEPATIVALRQG